MNDLPKPDEPPFVGRFVDRKLPAPGLLCAISGCSTPATLEVYRKGFMFYNHAKASVMTAQSTKCPFICDGHARELDVRKTLLPNSSYESYRYLSIGEDGLLTFRALGEAFPQIYAKTEIEPEAYWNAVRDVNAELAAYIIRNPDFLHQMSSRGFEQLVASIMTNQGFSVELTPETRDGGVDIVATEHSQFGRNLFLVECKKWTAKKVGIEKVQRLNGIIDNFEGIKVTRGILVTTSTFTKPALDFAEPLQYRLTLADHAELLKWIARLAWR